MPIHLVWFRNDLRIHDNLALAAACRNSKARVLALFIATPGQWRLHNMAPRQAWFIQQHVDMLQASLAAKGIPLRVLAAHDFAACAGVIKTYCADNDVDALFYNYQYELNERRRDAAVEKALGGKVLCQGFDDSVLLAPGSITTGNHTMYKIFTPFSKAFLHRLREETPMRLPAPQARESGAVKAPAHCRFDYPQQEVDAQLFPVGEMAALYRLRQFCRHAAKDYLAQRNFPALNGTSLLSAYLTVGVLSPRQCLHGLLAEHPGALEGDSGAVWLNQLIWREFYRHLLTYNPALCCHRSFIDWTEKVKWRNNTKALRAWQEGYTGYPIIDAAMRQLNATGWMHNRLRMVAASFLVKDLLIDWREGERYFISRLVDGDLAANNGGWQWSASTGTDASPWFRIFNPTTQGLRFDEQGDFIRYWVPELNVVPGKAVHEPWRWAEKNGYRLDYPRPIVEHKQARAAALAAYQAARTNKEKAV
ncbi:deoxyribodipyrimidine photo-lyase [Enterobacteriaceae bacterium YMB-R22]|jgi:deoxyribodipyrimidine photo-lyase|uniref:deoxyribodipyrimidine photo-lyase n=1 Tax=Tenebrionicola larvae TaxID=2815733 RepID=UPI002010E4DA|nr:deoxyribodipyrimidine photo-lyase [Tenebrionicola larvae]MBV4412361.1 deoxyribodipyrimidine photo-lyase [Tenebrionicola larvae]